MTRPPRALTWSLIVILALFVGLSGGFYLGQRFESEKFEVMKTASVAFADDEMSKGDYPRAIAYLHFTKAFEARRGSVDTLLAKAYLLDGSPCTAQEYAASHLRYMETNGLTSLSSYGSTQRQFEGAVSACAEARRTNTGTTWSVK